MALHKFLVGIDAAQLQNGVAHGGLDQHRNVAACFHLNDDLAHRYAQHILRQRFIGDAFIVTFQRFTPHQMHDHLQAHSAAHRCLAKNCLDIEQADTAHFEQVLQQVGAAPLNGGLVDPVQVHRIIGHQAVAA